MELKVSALLLVTSLLVQIPTSRAKPTEEELVNKKVSVNLPKRIASSVSHFNPDTHHYAAEASVVINRVVPSVQTYKPPQIEIPEPPKNLAKKLLVRSPEKHYSQDKHFDPALHDYEAEGLVLINQDSPLLTTQQHIFEPSHHPSLEGKPRNPIVKKTVVVKSSHGNAPVISHFHPAPHIYAAVGDVLIDKTTPNDYERVDTFQLSNFLSADEREKSSSHRVSTFSGQPPQQYATRESVKKSVTVQLPEHRISNINHFNPAGHKYAAKGEVNIDRENLGNQEQYNTKESHQTLRTTSHHSNKRRAVETPPIIQKTPETYRNQQGQAFKKTRLPNLAVKKQVSVQLPEHRISNVNHFNPAGHRYAAEGGVAIDRDASRPPVSIISTKKTHNKANVSDLKKKTRQTLNINQSTTAQYTDDKGKKVSVPFRSTPNRIQFKPRSSGLSVKKKVSVELPEHRISHINHFNPAGHRYAAQGGVEIDRELKGNTVPPLLIQVKQPSKQSAIRKKISPQSLKPSQIYLVPLQKHISNYERVQAPIESSRSQPSLKTSASGFSVRKAVSVELPEHRISHINHFNPAGHRYAAEGGVEIERDSSLRSGGLTQSQRRPSKPDVNIFKTSPRQPVQVRVKQPVSKPIVQRTIVSKSPKPTQTYRQPQRQIDDDDKIVKVPFQSTPRRPLKSISPGLSIKKEVSVQLPEHRISHINHFNPAGHRYAAAGGVEIERDASLRPGGLTQSQRRPSKPDVNIFKTSPRQPVQVRVKQPVSKPIVQRTIVSKSPKPTQTYRQPQRQIDDDDKIVKVPFHSTPRRPLKSISPGLSIKKEVSVQLPEHRISHINHFNPAGHRYAAEGGVEIERDASLRPGGLTQSQRRPSKPDVNIFKTSPRQPVQVRVKQPVSKPIVQRTIISKSPKPTQTYRQPQRQIDDDDRIVKVPFQSTPRRPLKSISPGLSIKKEVSVQLPEHRISHINHFNPAGHRYAAAGGVEIERDASLRPGGLTQSQRRPSKPDVNIFKTSPRQPVQVRVKQPVSKPIVQRTIVSKSPKPTQTYRQPQRQIDDDDKIVKVPFQSTPRRPLKSISPGLSIKKEVSVQLPEHRISHINHFNPAGHRYAAAGGVEIERDASLRPGGLTQSQRRPSKPDVNIFKTSPRQPVQVRVKQPVSKPIVQRTIVSKSPKPTQTYRQPQRQIDDDDKIVKVPFQSTPRRPLKSISPGLSIKKEVSVQLPEHRISHINHFNPAGHRYAAAGGVEIERDASLRPGGLTQSQRRPSKPDVNIFKTSPRQPVQVRVKQPVSKPIVQRTIVSKSPKPTQTYRQPQRQIDDDDKIVKVPFQSTPRRPLKSISPGLSIKKEVSVQLPEHRISHINHFNPAGHRYAAEGGVEIERDASLRPGGLTQSQRRPSKPEVNIFKTSPRQPVQVRVKQPVSKPIFQRTIVSKSPKPTQTYRQPQRQIDDDDKIVKVPFQSTPRRPLKSISPGLSIKKEVSVQLPEHRISHINHFNPTGHTYAAAGGVEIDKDVSSRPAFTAIVQGTPSILDANTFTTKLKQPAQVVVKHPAAKPVGTKTFVSQRPKPIQTFLQPLRQGDPRDKIVQVSFGHTPSRPLLKPSAPGLFVKKEVSVQLPEHRISHINHFNPAGHKYAAKGGVEITGDQPLRPVGISPVIKTPGKPGLSVLKTSHRESPSDSDGYFSSVSSDFQTIPTKPSIPTNLFDISPPEVSLPQTVPVTGKKDTSSDSGVSSSEDFGDTNEEKPTFDFGPAATYDFSDIASYLPPIPDTPRVSEIKIGVPTNLKQPPLSQHGGSRFQLEKEVSVKSPDHGSSVIAHFSPAVPKYKASNKVVISGGD